MKEERWAVVGPGFQLESFSYLSEQMTSRPQLICFRKNMSTLKKKKNAQCESFKWSFIGGKMRTAAQEAAPQISLRKCFKEVGRKDSICVIWGSIPGWERFPWRREWLPTPVFLPGESHEQRSLSGYGPWGPKESDTTEAAEHARKHRQLRTYFPRTFLLVMRHSHHGF